MGYVVRMPQLGMSMEEGTVVEWHCEVGDEVKADEVLVVIESEKTAVEVEAREEGFLGRVLVAEGVSVQPGDPIGIVVDPDEDPEDYESDLDMPEATGAADDGTGAASAGGVDGAAAASGESGASRADATASGAADVRATPGARKLASEEGIDLVAVEGTGPQGVVTDEDVAAHADAGGSATATAGGATRTVVESVPLSGMQETIADRLGESYREAIHVTVDRTFDAKTLLEAVAAAREGGLDISLTDLLLKAAGVALVEHPAFNAVFEDGVHRYVDEINIGVAVDVERGLVTPVVPDVAGRKVEGVAEVRRYLTERVQADDFSMDDLAGGTFTVTNLGMLDIDRFDPVINPPQVAILGVGRLDEDDTMTLSLSFDHRVLNGADAARFLTTVVDKATDPATIADFFDAEVALGGGRAAETREISVKSADGFSGSYRAGGVEVPVDEPSEAGGPGLAATPVEHLLGALGSCLTFALRSMAARDGVEVDGVDVEVSGRPTNGPLETVEVALHLESDATEDELDQAVTKAERACYVDRALAEDIEIDVTWQKVLRS